MKKYGKLYGYYSFNTPILTIGDPELIKQVCIKDWSSFPNRSVPSVLSVRDEPLLGLNIDETTDSHWQRIRQTMNPGFTSSKLKQLWPKIDESLSKLFEAVEPYVAVGGQSGSPVPMKQLYEQYVINIHALSIFSLAINAHKQPEHPYVRHTLNILNPNPLRSLAVRLLPAPVLKLLNMNILFEEESNEYFLQLTSHLMNERQLMATTDKNNSNSSTGSSSSNQYNDWLELLMTNMVANKWQFHPNNKGINGEKFTNEEILANAWILTTVGFDSTVTTHTYASYELANNPRLQQQVYDEVMSCMDTTTTTTSGRKLDYNRLMTIELLDSVISETLRLHSPAVRESRFTETTSDYQLGDTGISVKQGEKVEFPIYAIHHCEDYYPSASEFRPERFLPANRHQLIPGTYLPFGLGPRHCLAKQFVLMLVKISLANLLVRYRLSTCPQTDPRPLHSSLIYAPKHTLVLKFESRN
ncbi:lithocholate 6-beta-hydroxylase-like [Oppia nitens]|uniref:lithocholate 6-beta-hydroxylase-like n=1 Tax=Oppia nitens TaxID=1686743 RepID=UPI0023DB73D5|nr:lithocholate 6-beta-hydroxylase-like [Oppia nitens]